MLAYTLHAYHQTKHSELNKTPAQAWKGHFSKKPNSRVLETYQYEDFKYRFYPEVSNKKVVPGGIEIFRRFYYGRLLKDRVRDEVTVKYDPHDLSFIYVKLGEIFERIPCVRNSFCRSSDYEIYRWQRQQKGDRDGTMTKEGAQSYGEITKQKNKEVKLTTQEKRRRKTVKGKTDYKKQAGLHGKKLEGDSALSRTTPNRPSTTGKVNQTGKSSKMPSGSSRKSPITGRQFGLPTTSDTRRYIAKRVATMNKVRSCRSGSSIAIRSAVSRT